MSMRKQNRTSENYFEIKLKMFRGKKNNPVFFSWKLNDDSYL